MKALCVFVGRILMSLLFLFSAYWHITHWQVALDKTSQAQVMYPQLILVISTVLLILGGLSLLFGFLIKLGVLLLWIELIGTALIFHSFWFYEGVAMQLMLLAFLNKIALCGGLLVIFGTSFDVRKPQPQRVEKAPITPVSGENKS